MSAYALPGLFPPLESSLSQPSRSSYHTKPETDVNIVVKDARIDSARLVQSLASTLSSKSVNASVSSRPAHSYAQRRRPRSLTFLDPVVPSTTPQEDSMQFELSIMWNGRKYTAIRSFSTILTLRQELVRELGLDQSCSSLSNKDMALFHHQQHHPSSSLAPKSLAIPEVPRISDDDDASFGGVAGVNNGVVGRGFLFLQGMLRAYSPKLEGWLRHVTSMIAPHDSPSLSSFLCEEWKRLRSDETFDASLDSIEETEHDDMDE